MHSEQHSSAGKTFTTPLGEFVLEDWWDHLTGGSWMFANGNPAALNYAMRSVEADLPLDGQVVYGKIGRLGHILHESELFE